MPSPISFLSTMILGHMIQGISGQITITNDSSDSKNCPGVLQNGGNDDGYCCVGGELDLSTCEGWPICTGSSWEAKTVSCATKILVTAKDYDARIESASSKYLQDNEATTTADSAPSTTTISDSDDDDGNESGATASATSTEDNSTTDDSTTASSTGAISAEGTSSGASPSETNSASSIKMTSLVGGVVGSAIAIWMAI
ncbi:hypothetical protein FSARC_3924 [Fusarium sarcochroum]|uniref:Extracellular membrane protein CFEM domain-containing protein n=1 Tax=Fusarium sarcochroum TaxID=1208366 RepID=A0A8H4U2S4_9HYPO|nr:hypothetical protein FSARC_3924 [Fusarium sarcochroum]